MTAPETVPTGAVAEHLRALAGTMPIRGGRARPWWLPPETVTLPLDSPSLLVPHIARRLRAVHVPAGVLPINHNLSVARPRGGQTLDGLREALTCPRAQAWVAETASRLENG